MGRKRWGRRAAFAAFGVLAVCLCFYFLQRYWAHRNERFVPDYPRVELTSGSDYETVFLQTGLGRPAVDRLLEEGMFETLLELQELLFAPPQAECTALLGWFTREDRLETAGPTLVDLQPGDILLTLSTHTGGWRHGHAGLVIDSDTVLECAVLGTDSGLFGTEHWSSYSCFVVLRVRDADAQQRQSVADYAKETLAGVPYRLTAGLLGNKAPEPGAFGFGLHCIYLPWYAWQHFGYDLDSDGGRLVTAADLLRSGLVEVVQIYGMDPRLFLTETVGGDSNKSPQI